MSTQLSSRKKVELSPYKQKLQTNAPSYATVNTGIVKKKFPFTGDIMDQNGKGYDHNFAVDRNDNETSSACSRPDVLSLDSDFDSGNCLTESPDQDSSSPCLEKQKKFALEGMQRKKCDTEGDTIANYSYCTPPNHMASAISRVHLGKKMGHKKKGREDPPKANKFLYNTNVDPISSEHNHGSRGLYGRLPINGQHGLAPQLLDPSTSDSVVTSATTKGLLTVSAEGQQIVKEAVCNEAMDMKYTDLTHMQLKRSLEQIHCQAIPGHLENGFGPRTGENYRDYAAKFGPGLPTTFHGIASQTQESLYGSLSNQPSKYDAILKVKDAMLQEKESVILKLRLEVASLQHQVQESDTTLRQVIQTKGLAKPVSLQNPHSEQQNSSSIVYRKKIHNLEELLGKAEYQLTEANSHYGNERSRMEEKIQKLEAALKSKDLTFAETKKKYKANAERLEKYKKRVESLERYLGDLPTLEESNKLKTEAGLLGEERESLVAETLQLKDKLQSKSLELKEKEFLMKQCEEKETAYLQQIKHLEDKNFQLENSKRELGATERDELEDLKFECGRLKKESENATKMVSACEKRLKQQQDRNTDEVARLEIKLSEAEETNESMRRDQFLKQQTANKVHTAMMSLSDQNQQLLEEKLALQEKVKGLEKWQTTMGNESRVFMRLQRETQAAVQELKAVSQVLIQTAEGSDPNLSALLGVRTDSLAFGDDTKSRNPSGEAGATTDAVFSAESASKSIVDVRKLRQDLDHLRTMMTNRYAENIGENCTTQ